MKRTEKNIIDCLFNNAANDRDAIAFTFFNNSNNNEYLNYTWGKVNERTQMLSSYLSKFINEGDRVILLFPNNNFFIESILACFYAKIIPVPVEVPKNRNDLNKLENIIKDCNPEYVITESSSFNKSKYLENFKLVETIFVNELVLEKDFKKPSATIEDIDIALIQYTSGSTANPKGVVISHKNLMHNLSTISVEVNSHNQTIGVFWLPFFHDMGVFGTVFSIIYCSGRGIYMKPYEFIREPLLWLKIISDFSATATVSPNFAFDLVCDKYERTKRNSYDLSSLDTVLNGSENISGDTLNRFYNLFKKFKFNLNAFTPCYGMAECSLYISGETSFSTDSIIYLDVQELKNKNVKIVNRNSKYSNPYVSCGQSGSKDSIIIYNYDSKNVETEQEKIGEICVSSESVGQGYYNLLDPKNPIQFPYISIDNIKYFRTGDLGSLYDHNLFITGRKKDLIIIKGKNLYPADIEHVICRNIEQIIKISKVIFSIEIASDEKIVCAFEYNDITMNSIDTDLLLKKVNSVIFTNYTTTPNEIMVVKPFT